MSGGDQQQLVVDRSDESHISNVVRAKPAPLVVQESSQHALSQGTLAGNRRRRNQRTSKRSASSSVNELASPVKLEEKNGTHGTPPAVATNLKRAAPNRSNSNSEVQSPPRKRARRSPPEQPVQAVAEQPVETRQDTLGILQLEE